MELRSLFRPLRLTCLLAACVVFWTGSSSAQSKDDEPAAIVELGTTVERSFTAHQFSAGPDLAIEFTPIEHWLEIEVGSAPLVSPHAWEWDTDFLVKKPWTLSRKVEFMFGAGPEWIAAHEGAFYKNALGAEVVLDFMIWPTKSHKLGWFIEPGYEYRFGGEHEHSVFLSGGLLLAIAARHH